MGNSQKYLQKNPRPQLGLRVNFERILGEMTALASWVTPGPFGNALAGSVKDSSPNAQFTWPPDKQGDNFYRHLIIDQAGFLLECLADFMRDQSKNLDRESAAFRAYRHIFERLHEEFDLGIYNLNYDNVAHAAWPDAYTGFDDGTFDARGIGQRREWNFIYHLHGSVHYSFCDPPFSRTLEWRDDLNGMFETCRPTFPEMASEFKPIIPTTLVVGGNKLDQLLADPPQTFHAALVRHAHEADAVLIVGYGFGDIHVNRALKNRFDLSPFDPAERPPVVVVEKSSPTCEAMDIRQGHEFWAWEMTHTINTRFKLGSPPANTGPTIEPLLRRQELETCMHGRAAIWHNGFIETLESLDKILAWLRR